MMYLINRYVFLSQSTGKYSGPMLSFREEKSLSSFFFNYYPYWPSFILRVLRRFMTKGFKLKVKLKLKCMFSCTP